MIFSVNRNDKKNILNEYKQRALAYLKNKKIEKLKLIKEEKDYISELTKKFDEEDKKKQENKIKLQNIQKNEYKKMLLEKISLKNQNHFHSQSMQSQIINHESTPKKLFIQNEDNIKMYLNNVFTNREKNNTPSHNKNYYKNILDSQYQEIQENNIKNFGTNDILILEQRKRNYIPDNPYSNHNIYYFGKSKLLHNPITDPQNNIEYNKYIKFNSPNKNFITIDHNNNFLYNSCDRNISRNINLNYVDNIAKTNPNSINNENIIEVNKNRNVDKNIKKSLSTDSKNIIRNRKNKLSGEKLRRAVESFFFH